MRRVILPLLPTLLLSCGNSTESGGEAPAGRVILITCDTLRADHLGAYGCERGLTPNLDLLARSSRVFQEAYSCASLTGPALSCMLTGKLPHEIGVAPGNRSLMPVETFTIAEAISEKGIPTAAIVSNYVLRGQVSPAGPVGVGQGFDHFDDRMSERELNRPMYERRAGDTTAAAVAWLDEASARGQDRFFLWVHYQDPHGPYTPDVEFAERFDRPASGKTQLPIGRTHRGKGQLPAYQVLDGERNPEPYRGKYDGEVATFDSALGLLLDDLRERDLFDSSLLIFSADHGESLGEHDYWFGHGEHLYRDVVRIPLIIRFPGGIRAGTSPSLTSHLDLFPTALSALGLDPGPTHGVSLLSADPRGGRVALSSLGPIGSPNRQEAISDGRWRLMIGGGARPRLFDLIADPTETRDVARGNRDILMRLQEAALSLARGAGATISGVNRQMQAQDQKAFDDMGYGGGDGEIDDGR